MAISFIGSSSVDGATIAIPPSVAAGDLLIMFAFRVGSTTPPTVPAGWLSVGLNAGTTCSSAIVYKVATSPSEPAVAWTNANSVICHAYRGQLTTGSPIINSGAQTGTGTTANYSGITSMTSPGNSWVVRFAGHSSIDTSLKTAPSGYTRKTDIIGVSDEIVGFDTNTTVSSSTFAAVPVGGTSGNWITKTLELPAQNQGAFFALF